MSAWRASVRLVHLADTHLGYRAYHRVTPRGINLREADVAIAFREAIGKTIERRPDLVVVAGDVFHSVRPSNAAIADGFRQFARLRESLPDTPVVVIAGNHDTPRAAEVGSILRLFEEIPGVHVAAHEARRIHFEALDASVLALPHAALAAAETPAVEPDPSAGTNVLVAHAGVDHPKVQALVEYGGALLRPDVFRADDWSYVALGHYHLFQPLGPNMAYAGATERTSTNLWEEAASPKGFVEFDTETGELDFHTLESPRRVLDLEPVDVYGRSAEEVDAAVESAVESVEGGLEGKIVRLRLVNCPRPVYRALDHRRIRQMRARATHFHLDVRPPEVVRSEASGAPGRRATLEEEVERFLLHDFTPSHPETDRGALVALAREYLREVEGTTDGANGAHGAHGAHGESGEGGARG